MIDTHAHLYAEEFDDERQAVIQRAREAGISRIVLPNVDSTTLRRMLELEQACPDYCYAAIGVHPTSIGENWREELAVVEQELKRRNAGLLQKDTERDALSVEDEEKHQPEGSKERRIENPAGSRSNDSTGQIPPYIAIGEIGTDLYWDKTYLLQQQKAFAQQLQWSLDYHLPVIIHVRDSFDATFEVLNDFRGKGLRGVFHSFTGTAEQAHTINEFGTFYLGINGIITFKNSGLREVIASVPPERLVLETDSPYLSPAPYRGKRNESSRLPLIAMQLAEVYNLNPEKIAAITTKNAQSLFNFKGKT